MEHFISCQHSGMFAGVFAVMFIRSFERAERVQKAMDARGYNGKYSTHVTIPAPRGWEYTFLAAFVMIIMIAGWVSPFQGW